MSAETVNAILTGISTVGFPIVMCLIIFYQNEKTIDTLKTTIDNNTSIIKELIAKIDTLINIKK
ncbi:MAG: hypothetical protein VZR09_10885 [Candidatus Gastranaerophilaceae bacterium]|nr:hypothetical protein [Candidatus Gastranaerophilaceae bacterium]